MSLSKEYVSDSDSDEEVEFKAPKHYHKVKTFSKLPSNLDKKEIWLIKAPIDFKFDELKTLPISFNPLENGKDFGQSSKQFNVQEDLTNTLSGLAAKESSSNNKYTLITTKDGKKLQINKDLKINRFYNLKESVKLPEINYEKVVKKRKNIRVVKGLKPQHFATGYDATEEDVTSDVEVEVKQNKAGPKIDADGDVIVDNEVSKKDSKSKKEKKEKKEKKSKKEKK